MPEHEKRKQFRKISQALASISIVVLAWVSSASPFFSFVTFVFLVLAALLAIKWRSWILALAVCLNPLTIAFAFGLAEWFQHKPQFWTMGLPGDGFYNLDRTTRCYHATGGCKVNGSEWTRDIPHNMGLQLMASVLGAPRGTYDGPYPTKEEAIILTTSAPQTPVDQFLKDSALIDARSISLRPGTADRFCSDFGLTLFDDDSSIQIQSVRAARASDRCVLVRVAVQRSALDHTDAVDAIVLIDSKGLRPFAIYSVVGRSTRIPRLLRD